MWRRTKEYTENRNSPKGYSGSGRRLPGGGDTRVLTEEQESSQLNGVGIGNRQEREIWRMRPAPSALPALPWVTELLQSRGLGLLLKHSQPKHIGTMPLPGGGGGSEPHTGFPQPSGTACLCPSI